MHDHAIAILTMNAEAAEHNAPIWEKENDPEQAALSRETAKSCRTAIEILKG